MLLIHVFCTKALAEAVDLFQTFVELAGLPDVPDTEGLQVCVLIVFITLFSVF